MKCPKILSKVSCIKSRPVILALTISTFFIGNTLYSADKVLQNKLVSALKYVNCQAEFKLKIIHANNAKTICFYSFDKDGARIAVEKEYYGERLLADVFKIKDSIYVAKPNGKIFKYKKNNNHDNNTLFGKMYKESLDYLNKSTTIKSLNTNYRGVSSVKYNLQLNNPVVQDGKRIVKVTYVVGKKKPFIYSYEKYYQDGTSTTIKSTQISLFPKFNPSTFKLPARDIVIIENHKELINEFNSRGQSSLNFQKILGGIYKIVFSKTFERILFYGALIIFIGLIVYRVKKRRVA